MPCIDDRDLMRNMQIDNATNFDLTKRNDELASHLCGLLTKLEEKKVLHLYVSPSSKLGKWWESHKIVDALRAEQRKHRKFIKKYKL